LADALRAVEAQLRSLLPDVERRLGPAFDTAARTLQRLRDAIADVDLDGLVDRVAEGGPAFAALAAGMSAAGGAAVLSPVGFGGLAGAISPLGAAITAAALASPELRDVLLELLAAVTPLVPALLDTATILAEVLSSGLSVAAALIQPIVPLVETLVDAFTARSEEHTS